MSRTRLLLVFILVAATLGSLLPVTAQDNSELRFGIGNNVDVLDPNLTTFSSVGTIMFHVFDPLVWQDPLGTFLPGLATDWTVNDDATEYTFNLRSDVMFHDGTPFNAEAVKFTFDRIANPDTGAQTAFSLLGPYKESEVVDDDTVIVRFNTPFAPFLNSISSPYLGISSPTAIESMGADYGQTDVVGTGPYMLDSYVPDSEVVLVRNPDYNWGSQEVFGMSGPGNFERIVFKIIQEPATRLAALESGEVHFIDEVPELDVARLSEDPNVVVVQMEQPGHGWSLMMNVENPPTDELAVRQAIALATNKQGLIDTVFNGIGTPACSALTKNMFGYDPASCDHLPYDPAQAGAVLDEAGWVMNDATGYRERDGERLVIQHYYRADNPLGASMATYMQADLLPLGIEVQLNGLSRAGYFDAVRSGQHNTQNWWDTFTDPDGVYRTLFYSANADGGTNRNRYVNADLDAMIDEAAATTDSEARAALYAEIQQFVDDEAIMVYFVDPFLLYAHTPALQGVKYLSGGNLAHFYGANFAS